MSEPNACTYLAIAAAVAASAAAVATSVVGVTARIRELSPDQSDIVVPHVAQVEVDKEQQENAQHAKKIHGHRITGDAC